MKSYSNRLRSSLFRDCVCFTLLRFLSDQERLKITVCFIAFLDRFVLDLEYSF